MALTKSETTVTKSRAAQRKDYNEELEHFIADTLCKRVAKDLDAGNVTESIAMHAGSRGDVSSLIMRLLTEFGFESADIAEEVTSLRKK